ncbi:hypothetical protein KIW84_033623 [Lathyrus oleraceus]|uniref:Uncharacterized protein n=1 Tax=Pisum sativum TaxID=3888 RepID=A0A9D4Y0L9_PEA|nr:hypothetical protein KIW84_033623 [Pisum sativum]
MSNIVRQVYYVPYPSIVPHKRGWCVVIKTKPLGHIETGDLVENVAYQVDEVEQINDVIVVEKIISLSDTMVEGHQVDAPILLVENNVDEEHEELGSEDNITSDDENDMDKEHGDFEYFFFSQVDPMSMDSSQPLMTLLSPHEYPTFISPSVTPDFTSPYGAPTFIRPFGGPSYPYQQTTQVPSFPPSLQVPSSFMPSRGSSFPPSPYVPSSFMRSGGSRTAHPTHVPLSFM